MSCMGDTLRPRAGDGIVDRMLAAVLGRAVFERLELIEEIADRGDDGSVVRLARQELPRVLATLATILRDHEPDDAGRCPQCGGRLCRRPHPCSVWQTAHHLLADETRTTNVRAARNTTEGGS